MEEVKIRVCVGCKWCVEREHWDGMTYYPIYKCSHPACDISIVDGQTIYTGRAAREDPDKCGIDGKLWEPIPPSLLKRLWTKLTNIFTRNRTP